MSDRIFTIEAIRKFSREAAEAEARRMAQVRTGAGKNLIAKSRTVETQDGATITVTDGDVLDAIRDIEAEAAAAEHRRLARLGAERTTPEEQAAALRKYNPEIVAVIEAGKAKAPAP